MNERREIDTPIATPRPWIVGHRGVAGEKLENTLESLELAVEQGADMIELDVQLTADDTLVAFHDWDLERLAGRPEVVEESDLETVLAAFPRLPTLRRILDTLPKTMPLNVELKCRRADTDRYAQTLAEELGERGRILLSSFDWKLLEGVRATLPEIPMAPLAEEETAAELLEEAERLGAWALHCHHPLADAGLVRAAEAAGRPVLVYTVNEAERARELIELGVAGLFTDFPGRLRAELQSPG